MSLRTRFIALFTVLAVIPLVGVGVFSYRRSVQAVEALVATQVEEIARDAARQMGDRYALQESNLLLLADNEETHKLFSAYESGDPAAVTAARGTAEPYLEQAWRVLGDAYEWIEFRDRGGRVLYAMGEEVSGPAAGVAVPTPGRASEWMTLQQPIGGGVDVGGDVGVVEAAVSPDGILPYETLEARFGSSGYSMVLDRSTGRVVYHPRHAFWRRTLSELVSSEGWEIDPTVFQAPEGSFTYRENDSIRVAFFQNLDKPPWTVLASGSVAEFGAPFARTRTGNLALIFVLALAVAGAYAILAQRATRSLTVLTRAADRVGNGDFSPNLPKGGTDEVGRLAGAFRTMVARVRESLEQMEASRQLAAVGQFASQISHEIRNPLTSMKLNLQGLKRDVEGGRIPAGSAKPVELCLKEVERLDRVVTGVLNLSRSPSGELTDCSVHEVIENALEVLRGQLGDTGIHVETDLQAESDRVSGDSEALESVLINLFLNACEAMAVGGTLTIRTETLFRTMGRSSIRVEVADSGPGVPPEVREEIFKPFFSTKKTGTGLGLTLAARVVESHQGELTLLDTHGGSGGSVFLIQLPLVPLEDDA